MEKKILYITHDNDAPFEHRYAYGSPDARRKANFKQLLETLMHDRMRGLIYDYEINLAPGTYYLGAPIEIDSRISSRLTFKADSGEVILSGGKRIGGFRPCRVNGVEALVADIPEVRAGEWYFEELYVNKGWRSRPVSPKGGAKHQITNVPNHPIENYGSIAVKAFEAGDGAFDGIAHPEETTVEVLHYWLSERMSVTAYDKESKTVHFDRLPRQRLVDSTSPVYAKYRILNVFEALTEPGEWYLDRYEGKLYYIPLEGETADNILVEAPALQNLVVIKGKRDERVTDISFEGITFECTRSSTCDENDKIKYATSGQAASNRDGAVKALYAKNIFFEDCTFRDIGNYAAEGSYGCENFAFDGCSFYHIGAGAVKFGGASAYESEKDASGGIRVENCEIYDCAKIDYGAIGIYVAHGAGTYIAHNHIHHLKYSGISVGWVWGMLPSRTSNAVIEYNHIHDLGDGDMSDMGGIYLLGPHCGSEVRGNYVHDVHRAVYGGEGIYLDEGSTNVVVEKNVVYNCDSACMMIHYGAENIVRYNIFGHGDSNVAIGAACREGIYLNVFKNIFFVEDNPVYLGAYNVTLEFPICESDMNFIYKKGDTPLYNVNETHVPAWGDIKRSWEDWQAQGKDVYTKVFAADGPILRTPEELKKYGFPALSAEEVKANAGRRGVRG